MSFAYTCDWCGDVIEDDEVRATLSVNQELASGDYYERLRTRDAGGWIGDYHREECWPRVLDAIRLAEAAGPSLESVPTISGQAVAARRRKHRRGEEA